MIKIDPQFKALCRALTKDEYEYLEASLQDDGCDNPIILWNDTIVDGHNRYEICQKHGIEFNILNKEFESREDAMLWIIHNQLARRNLSDLDRVALLEAKRPLLAKQARERQRAGGTLAVRQGLVNLPNPENKVHVRDQLASEAGMSGKTYDSLRKVNEKGGEELKQAVREKKVSASRAAKIAELPKEKQDAEISSYHDPASPPIPKIKNEFDDNDSETVIGLKRYWKQATKKDKKKFMNWLMSNNELKESGRK